MDVTMLLCDAAQEVNGKLYILGGGWSYILAPKVPVNGALAIKVSVPWDRSNHRHKVRAALVTEDGDPVEIGEVSVVTEGAFEVGRPPGIKPGTPLDAAFVLDFAGLVLETGGYVWELYINDTLEARVPLRVQPGN